MCVCIHTTLDFRRILLYQVDFSLYRGTWYNLYCVLQITQSLCCTEKWTTWHKFQSAGQQRVPFPGTCVCDGFPAELFHKISVCHASTHRKLPGYRPRLPHPMRQLPMKQCHRDPNRLRSWLMLAAKRNCFPAFARALYTWRARSSSFRPRSGGRAQCRCPILAATTCATSGALRTTHLLSCRF